MLPNGIHHRIALEKQHHPDAIVVGVFQRLDRVLPVSERGAEPGQRVGANPPRLSGLLEPLKAPSPDGRSESARGRSGGSTSPLASGSVALA